MWFLKIEKNRFYCIKWKSEKRCNIMVSSLWEVRTVRYLRYGLGLDGVLKWPNIDRNGFKYWLKYTNSIKCHPKIDPKIEAYHFFWVIDKFFVESIPDDIYRQRPNWCCHAYWFKLLIPIDIVRNFLTTYPQVLFKSLKPAYPFHISNFDNLKQLNCY